MLDDKKVNFNITIDKNLKDRFVKVAKANETTGSQMIRLWIKKYLSENAQGKFKETL